MCAAMDQLKANTSLKATLNAVFGTAGLEGGGEVLTLLCSIQETENNDDTSSDGTNSNASNEERLEGWDEETTLVKMLGCLYSNPFPFVTR